MKSREGFTLIELMIVVLIVSILAAVAIPLMRGRIDSAKWSEGKAMMGTIATAIRQYHAKVGTTGPPPASLWIGDSDNLGFNTNDLDGSYFDSDYFSFEVTSMNPLTYTITAVHPSLEPSGYTLDQDGLFEEVE
jgi:prepilin-type N-terminal cleavage/methylation domain-containing protein